MPDGLWVAISPFLAPGFPETPQGHLIVPGLEPYSFLSQVALSLMELEPARV